MALDRKQKILIPLIVLAFVYVVWQVYDMFGGELTSSKTAPSKSTKVAKSTVPSVPSITTATTTTSAGQQTPEIKIQPIPPTPAKQPVTVAPTTPAQPAVTSIAPVATAPAQPPMPSIPAQAQPAGTATVAPVQSVAQQAPVAQQVAQQPLTTQPQPTTQPMVTPEQANYLRLMQQYQMLKVERMIVEEQAAIASAKERIARINETAMKYGGDAGVSTLTQPMNAEAGGYRLMYVDFQKGRWTATLNKAGQYMEVTEDTTLVDGTKVLAIDQQGITLAQGDKKYYLTFYGAMPLPSDSTLYSPGPVKQAVPVEPIPTSVPAGSQQAPASNAPAMPEKTAPAAQPATNAVTSAKKTNQAVAIAPQNQAPDKKSQLVSTAPSQNSKAAVPVVNQSATKPNVPQVAVQNNALKNVSAPKEAVKIATNDNKPALQQTEIKPVEQVTPKQNDQMSAIPIIRKPSVSQPAQSASAYTDAEQALLNLPTHYFTIQVRSGTDKEQLINFAKENRLNNATVFVTLYRKRPWYILTYGTFENYELAQQAVKQMPTPVQSLHPWVRPIVTVQNAVKEFHDKNA